MGFTAPTQTNWTSAALRNEIISALWERWIVTGNVSSAHKAVPVTDSAQSALQISQLQSEIDSLCTSYCNDANNGGDFTGMAAFPLWQTTNPAGDNFLFDAMAGGQTGWRRQTVKGTWATPGWAVAGDLWGPWIFEDLQRALLLLKWVVLPAGFMDGHSIYGYGGSSNQDWETSKEIAIAAYNDFSPNNGDTTRIMAYTNSSWNTAGGGDDIRAIAYRQYGNFGNAACPALANVCEFELYGLAVAPPWFTGVEANFDNNGEGWIKDKFYKCGHATQEAVGVAKLPVGNAGIPVWVDPPEPGDMTETGYQLHDGAVVLHAVDAFEWT